MKRLFLVVALIAVLGFVTSSNATLINNGSGLIYDTDLNKTWYDYTYTGPSGYGASWSQAMNWASSLNVGNVSGWKLPTSDTSCAGYNCTGSNMGHLYYTELGLTAGTKISSTNQYPFTNLLPAYYWTSTEYQPNVFALSLGHQAWFSVNQGGWALAVHSGNVSITQMPPVPTSTPNIGSYIQTEDLFTSKTTTFINEHSAEYSIESKTFIQYTQTAVQDFLSKPLSNSWKDTFNTMSEFSKLMGTAMSLTATSISAADPLLGIINLGIHTGKEDVLHYLHLENSASARLFLDSVVLLEKTAMLPFNPTSLLLSVNAIIYSDALAPQLAILANDPPDLNFTTVYQAPIFHGGPLNFTGISPELNALLGLELDSLYNTNSYMNGLTTTINRYASALSANDAASAGLQFQAFLSYLSLYDASAKETAGYINQLHQMFIDLGIEDSAYNAQSILDLQNYLATNGLSPELYQFYLSLGMSDAEIAALVQSMLGLTPPTNMNMSLYSSLTSMRDVLLTVSSTPQNNNVPEPATLLLLGLGLLGVLGIRRKMK